METYEEVLVSLRQIIRAIDLYSKKLKRDFGLTSPQLLLMRAIRESGNITIRQLSANTNMSQATATSILDRLENRGFVVRQRDENDKRKVHAVLTHDGKALLRQAPQIMQQNFITQFQSLDTWEQNLIVSTLQRVADMMNVPQEEQDTLFLLFNDPHTDSSC